MRNNATKTIILAELIVILCAGRKNAKQWVADKTLRGTLSEELTKLYEENAPTMPNKVMESLDGLMHDYFAYSEDCTNGELAIEAILNAAECLPETVHEPYLDKYEGIDDGVYSTLYDMTETYVASVRKWYCGKLSSVRWKMLKRLGANFIAKTAEYLSNAPEELWNSDVDEVSAWVRRKTAGHPFHRFVAQLAKEVG